MKNVVTTAPTGKGWNYNVYVGCTTNNKGEVDLDTADEIVGGWQPTRQLAKEKGSEIAHEKFEN